MSKRLITVDDVREAARSGKQSIVLPSSGCIVTPLARDEADLLKVILDGGSESCIAACDASGSAPENQTDKLVQTDALAQTVSELLQARGLADAPAHQIESIVREVVTARLGAAADASSPAPRQAIGDNNQGIRFVDGQRLLKENGALLPIKEKMLVANAIGTETGERLTGGYMVWENATFSRCLDQPEIAIVIDGELHLIIDGETLVGKPGDMIYFPKGATVDYHTPATVKLACVNCV